MSQVARCNACNKDRPADGKLCPHCGYSRAVRFVTVQDPPPASAPVAAPAAPAVQPTQQVAPAVAAPAVKETGIVAMIKTTAEKTAPIAASTKSVLGTKWFGVPLWLFLVMAVLLISMPGKILNINTASVGALKAVTTTTDGEDLIRVGSVELPLKRSHVPVGRWPLQGSTTRQIVAFAILVAFLPIVMLDNATKRPNQDPALRSNIGLLVFNFVGPWLLGWWAAFIAIAGLIMARRSRSGRQASIGQALLLVAFGLYVWFDWASPYIALWLTQAQPYAPWLKPFVEWLVSGDNSRPLAVIVMIGMLVVFAFRDYTDATSLIVTATSWIAWYLAMARFPYLEDWSANLMPVVLWTTMAAVALALIVENVRTGTVEIPFMLMILYGAAYSVSYTLRARLGIEANSWAWVLTTPLATALIFQVILARWLGGFIIRYGQDPKLGGFLGMISRWTGQVLVYRGFAIMVDAMLWGGLFWVAILLGTNWLVL